MKKEKQSSNDEWDDDALHALADVSLADRHDVAAHRCQQCNSPMNPVDFMIGPICLKCCKLNHAKATA